MKKKKTRWNLKPASPDSFIFDFVNRKVNINDNDDIIKWATPVKEMRDAYKLYFKTFSAVCPEIRFVRVVGFNKLLKELGIKQATKQLTIWDDALKKHMTKQYRCWVGCKLVG